MTQFDNLLQYAFEAGYERGVDDESYAERGSGPHTNRPPDFEEWRATISGLDLREDLGPIEIGDRVRVLSSWGSPFEVYHGAVGEVYSVQSDLIYVNVRRSGGIVSLAVPRDRVEKVRA